MKDSTVALSDSAAELVERLKRALRRDGDFPVSAKVVSEIAKLTANPKTTATQLSDTILKEPTLGTRVLHLVNSSFYRRSVAIMTVSQAVVQIGMKPLADLCSNLVLMQRFVPAARQGGAFATCLRRTVITSALTNLLAVETSEGPGSSQSETGHLMGLFSEMGTLLLAFYFPQIYDSALKRAEQKRVDVSQALQEITGLTPIELSLQVLAALELPSIYADILQAGARLDLPAPAEVKRPAEVLYAARAVSALVASGRPKRDLDEFILALKTQTQITSGALASAASKLPKYFRDYCDSVELTFPELPVYLDGYSLTSHNEQAAPDSEADLFKNYLQEIKVAVESREPTASIITTVMETLAWGLGFDRVLLLVVNNARKQLVGRMALGQTAGLDPTKLSRSLGPEAGPYALDAVAFQESRVVFSGDPILDGGWPIAALPVGYGARAFGVVYADRLDGDRELTLRQQAAITMLAELLDRSIALQQG